LGYYGEKIAHDEIHESKQFCSPCGRKLTDSKFVGRCKKCESNLCNKCSKSCADCKKLFCVDCLEKIEIDGKNRKVCDDCEWEYDECDVCEKHSKEKDVITCETKKGPLGIFGSSHKVCKKCATKCKHCKNLFCKDHLSQHGCK